MKIPMTGLAVTFVLVAAMQPAAAYFHANRFGGSTARGWGGAEHTNAWGGSTAHAWGGGTEHTNVYGGTTAGKYGEGAYHSTPYGATAYYPHDYNYGYHPPATVNYYGSGCYNCGGWDAAGAAVAGAVVGATVATAAESANSSTETTNAYNAGVAAGSAQAGAAETYTMGAMYPKLPAGCVEPKVQGVAYYLCGNTWFQPVFGSSGVYYKVVPTP